MLFKIKMYVGTWHGTRLFITLPGVYSTREAAEAAAKREQAETGAECRVFAFQGA